MERFREKREDKEWCEKSFASAQKVVFVMLFFLLLLMLSLTHYEKNSISINENKYRRVHESSYESVIANKKRERANFIYLKNGQKLKLDQFIYDGLKVGDTVRKPKSCDSIFISVSSIDSIISIDINKGLRNHLEQLKKEK